MAEVFVTLQEAADLEEVDYEVLKKRIQRDVKNQYSIINGGNSFGGKDRKLIAVSSLSQKAQAMYREQQRLSETFLTENVISKETVTLEEPWYVTVDVTWYMETYREHYYKAVELGNIVREFLAYEDMGKASYAEEYAKEHLGKSARTLYRYVESYLESCAWSKKKNEEDSMNYDFFKVLALCRKPKECGQFPTFAPEVKQVIKNIWFDKEFAQNRQTVTNLYTQLERIAKHNHWEQIPSYQSVHRYICYLLNEGGMGNAYALAMKGVRDFQNENMIKTLRNTSEVKVMEMVMGDGHTFDLFVEYKTSNGKKIAIRPTLVAWIDLRSRAIVGDVICQHSNANIIKQSILKMIYSAPIGGVPEYLLIDNGKDFTAETNTGRKRNKRSEQISIYDIEELDEVSKGFYKSIGIKGDHRALPYQPWTKAQIERFFGKVCTKFAKTFTSYVGTLTGSKTENKVPKNIQKMLQDGKLMTMDEFYLEWTQWLQGDLKEQHSGLVKQKEVYRTPYDLFQNGERYYKAPPPKSYAVAIMMEVKRVRVNNTGISRFGCNYMAYELKEYIGKTVNIRYDPNDLRSIFVLDLHGKQICEAESYELMGIGSNVSQERLEKHLRMQNRQIADAKKVLEEARKPFEDMDEDFVGFNSVVGGIDLMRSGKGKKKGKIISLPEDKTFRQNADVRKREREEKEVEYLAKTAESALAEIRAIGQ